MLPAIMALRPAIKYGILAGIVALVIGGYFGWKEYQQYIGREEVRAEQQAELTKQQHQATEEAVRQSDIRQQHVEELIQVNASLQARLEQSKKEIDRYAKKKVCPLDDDAVRIVNDLARVLDDTTADERVSTSGEAAGEPPVETQATVAVTDTAALIQRIAELTERESMTDAAHRKLSEYVIAQYEQALRFYMGQRAEQPNE